MAKMKLMCDGKLINENSEDTYNGSWSNPIDTLPPIGSIIDYMTFDEEHYKKGEGVLTSYKVIGIRFYTREGYNNTYKDKTCTIELEKLEE